MSSPRLVAFRALCVARFREFSRESITTRAVAPLTMSRSTRCASDRSW